MSPEHLHVVRITARFFRRLPWPMRTNEYEKVCRCKDADRIAGELREMADQSASPLGLTVWCDVRGTVSR